MDPFTAINQLGPIIRKIGEDFDALRTQAEAQTELLSRIAAALEFRALPAAAKVDAFMELLGPEGQAILLEKSLCGSREPFCARTIR